MRQVHFRVPESLHQSIRLEAAYEGVSLGKVLTRAMIREMERMRTARMAREKGEGG